MTNEKLTLFIHQITEVMLKAGKLAIESQKNVRNIGKATEVLPNDSAFIQKMRSAKTVIDEEVQELLLSEVAKVLNPKEVKVDAEEETPSIKLFTGEKITLVVDPIDGTLEYLKGKDSYSICIGVIEKGKVIIALVYFPKRDTFYFINDGGDSCFVEHASKTGLKNISLLKSLQKISSKDIYRNNRVQNETRVLECLISKGYKIYDDSENRIPWPDGILKCISGEYLAVIFHTPQIRDVLLGAILANIPGGYAIDWKGNPLIWPAGGRIPGVVFGFDSCPQDILDCLKV